MLKKIFSPYQYTYYYIWKYDNIRGSRAEAIIYVHQFMMTLSFIFLVSYIFKIPAVTINTLERLKSCYILLPLLLILFPINYLFYKKKNRKEMILDKFNDITFTDRILGLIWLIIFNVLGILIVFFSAGLVSLINFHS